MRRCSKLWEKILRGGVAAALSAVLALTALPQGVIASEGAISKKENDSNPSNYTTVEFDKEYSGVVDWDQTDDNSYIIIIGQPGRVTLTTHSKGGMYYTIMDNDSLYSDSTCKIKWRPDGSSMTISGDNVHTIDLIAEKYYLYVTGYPRDDDGEDAKYSFTMSFEPFASDSNEELLYDEELGGTNNEKESARPIEVGKKYKAFISEDTYNKDDWYTFTLKKPTTLYLSAGTTEINYGIFRLHNGTTDLSLFGEQPEIYNDKSIIGYKLTVMYAPWNKNKPSAKLPKGTYYLQVPQGSRTTGSYSFTLATSAKAAKPVKSLNVKQKKLNMTIGSSEQLSVTVKPSNAYDKNVSYVSSDPLVATVDNKGKVTALRTGVADITIMTNSKNGVGSKGKQLTKKCEVTVN